MGKRTQVITKRGAFEGRYCCILVLLFLSGGVLIPVAHAATFYIDSQNGNDSRTTTQAQNASTPWLTIQKCANNAVAGDTCSVASGTYNERPNATTNGSSGNYITYKSAPARSATILGFDINSQYVRVEGFNVTNPSDTCDNITVKCINGISINGSYAQVVNNYIYNWRGAAGIGPTNMTWASRYSSVSITHNLIYHSQYGITIWGDNWMVDHNEVNKLWPYTFEGGCTGSWDCDYMRIWGVGISITNNYFHGTVIDEVEMPGCSPRSSCHVDTFQTWSYHSGYVKDLLFDKNMCLDAHEIMVENQAANPEQTNWTISNNVFANGLHMVGTTNRAGGMNVQGSANSYFTFINNTVYNQDGAYGSHGTHSLMRNNIISLAANGTYIFQFWDATDSEDYNHAYKPGGSAYCDCNYADSSIFSPTDQVNVNPLFVNSSDIVGPDGIPFTADDGLQLQAGSPARGAGYGKVDIGAYQYVPGGDTTPPAVPAGLSVK